MESGTSDMNSCVDSLTNMFIDVVSKDVINTVAESCGGDLNLSVDAIMKITQENNDTSNENTNITNLNKEDQPTISNISESVPQQPNLNLSITETISYSAAFKNSTGASPKQRIRPITSIPKDGWNKQIRNIITIHNSGGCILIIMRGAPGSGKTYLAEKIIEMTIGSKLVDFKTHICSTDDYFRCNGQYRFNKLQLYEAHQWNQNRAILAMQEGLSPIVIDNTNIELWEMEPYVRAGVANGYIIEVVEPNTPWAKKANQLARRNIHNVPLHSIKRMLDSYISGITGNSVVNYFGLHYPADKIPPVLRTMPPVEHPPVAETSNNINSPTNLEQPTNNTLNTEAIDTIIMSTTGEQNNTLNEPVGNHDCIDSMSSEYPEGTLDTATCLPVPISLQGKAMSVPNSNESIDVNLELNLQHKKVSQVESLDLYIAVQKQLEEIQKVEEEWENGENWGDDNKESPVINDQPMEHPAPKPPRVTEQDNFKEKFLENVDINDWRQISMFMPPWQDNKPSQTIKIDNVPIETTSTATCMEIGDLNNSKNKVITANPRDINQFHVSFHKERIPQKRLLDKSSMTNEVFLTNSPKRCENEEKHFKEFRKLFKNIPKNALREIFDTCLGDVNWAVEIVLDGVATKQLATIDSENISDDEDDTSESEKPCTCLAAYQILPDASDVAPLTSPEEPNTAAVEIAESSSQFQKKSKKENNISDASLTLKRMIEQNVGFSNNHYSEHSLKLMKYRRGEHELVKQIPETSNHENSTSPQNTHDSESLKDTACCLDSEEQKSDDDDSSLSADDSEKTVNINLGREFISELDMLFGRTNMTYPNNVVTKINIPLSLLNEINALWMESYMHQLDEQDKQLAIMCQEDEEIARQLAMMETELALSGKEQEVPDFKEIMDLELAQTLYQKDVAEWRTKEPNDLAAKLTREKLYNLFPDLEKEILSELLMAHDNNFQSTVEILLVSTGKADILKQKNGLNKFVMQSEMKRQKEIIEEKKKDLKLTFSDIRKIKGKEMQPKQLQKRLNFAIERRCFTSKALSEIEYPLLSKSEGVVDMSVVDNFRQQAEQHLKIRNLNHQKASDYIRRGMLQAATHFSTVANYHRLRYEQANSMAAATLVQVHAERSPNNTYLDLHYYRVLEALEYLDIFIDHHLQRLRESQGRGQIYQTLFIVTGRGRHSNWKPRIKPAVKKRLVARGLTSIERNPGLLATRVSAEDRMTHEIN